jgi:hypothetical protein
LIEFIRFYKKIIEFIRFDKKMNGINQIGQKKNRIHQISKKYKQNWLDNLTNPDVILKMIRIDQKLGPNKFLIFSDNKKRKQILKKPPNKILLKFEMLQRKSWKIF